MFITEKRLREIIREELDAALSIRVTLEKRPEQGQPAGAVETRDVHVLAFLAEYIPSIEGALRGVQADANRATNAASRAEAAVAEMGNQVQVVGRTLLGMERSARALAVAAGTVQRLKLDVHDLEADRALDD